MYDLSKKVLLHLRVQFHLRDTPCHGDHGEDHPDVYHLDVGRGGKALAGDDEAGESWR